MERSISSTIAKLPFFLLLGITLLLSEAYGQSMTIRGGGSADTAQVENGALKVTGEFTVEGAAGGTSQSDNSAVTDITGMGALYDDTPPSITDGNVGLPRMNSSRQLLIECATGCGGGTQYDEDTAHASGDKLTMAGVLQKAADGATAADGDRTLIQVDGSGFVKANVKSSALPSGAATSANQTTIIGHVDGVETLLGAIQTATEGIQAGIDLQQIGGNNVATSNGVFSTGTLRVIEASNSALNTATSAIQTAVESLATTVDTGAVTVSGSISCSNCSGSGASKVDDAAFGVASDSVAPLGAMLDNTSPDSVDEGDVGVVRMSGNRNLFTTIRDAAGNERGVNVNASNQLSVSVDNTVTVGSHAVTNAGTFAVQPAGSVAHDAVGTGVNPVLFGGYASAAAPTSVSGDGDAVRAWYLRNGAQATVLTAAGALIGGDATNGLDVDVTRVTGTVTTSAAGAVAHDAADSGNPIKVGAKASTSLAGLTLVANADRTDLFAGIDGALITRPYANLEDRVNSTASITDGSSTSVVAAQGSGVRFCATTLVVSNSSATNVTVDIRDGTAGSVLMPVPAAANMGGAVVPLPVPLCTSANTALAADPSAAATTVAVTAVGFKTKL
jgi:hypothetical protein